MPEIAEREPKVTSAGWVHVGMPFRGRVLCTRALSSSSPARRTVYALGGAEGEEMVLFIPS